MLEQALLCAVVCEAAEAKLRAATKAGRVKARGDEKIAEALKLNIITAAEAESLEKMKSLRRSVIMVDDFPPDFGKEMQAEVAPARSSLAA